MLEQLKPFYPQIRRVQNLATQRVSYEYAYSFSDPDGFWSIPSPTLHHPITDKMDSYGYFGVLSTPTINRHWSFTTKSLRSEADEEDSQVQAEKPVPRSFDALVKPAVPSSCVSEDMESFLSSGPLAEWKTQVHGQPVGRYLSVDPEIFQQTSFIKWDAHTLLPSIDYKARLVARDTFSALDMLRAQEDKTRELLVNWNKPYVWNREKGVERDELGELVEAAEGLTLEESVSKEDLRTELHMRSRLNNLVISQLVHQSKVIVALQSEVRLQLRELFLYKTLNASSNKTLLSVLQNSRISVPSLFGPVPDYYKHKITHHGDFPSLKPPVAFRISGPLPKKKFPGGPSGNRGFISSEKNVSFQHAARGQSRLTRGSKNFKRGGRPKPTQVSQLATRGAAPKSRGRSRGGKALRGARGKRR